MRQKSYSEARLSTYSSGAPSLQPSLAATMDTTSSARSSTTTPYPSRFTEQTSLTKNPAPIPEAYSTSTRQQPTTQANLQSSTLASTSTLTLSSTDPRAADLRSFAAALDKLAEPRLESQRYVMSGHKTEEVSKNALGAKLDRALSRRMVGQDASFTHARAEGLGVVDEKMAEGLVV